MRAESERLINGVKAPTAAELRQWQQEAPYFVLPAFCRLKNATDLTDEERQRLLGQVAIQASDREALYDLIGDDEARFANFYPDRRKQPTTTTEDTIDSFLETFGHGNARETEALTRMIFNPVPSYEATMLAEANGMPTPPPAPVPVDEEDNSDDALNPEPPVARPKTSKPSAQTGNLSESFAKIMIKNGNYERALAIINELSLNNPEKSIYFADQIRFLQKLIINKRKSIN